MIGLTSFGCVLYNVSAWGFSLLIICLMILSVIGRLARRKKLAHLSWQERLDTPKDAADQSLGKWVLLLSSGAAVFFAIGVFLEMFGLTLGLYGDQLFCPQGWQQPRALRSLGL